MNKNYQNIIDKYVKGSGPLMQDINPATGKSIAEFKTMNAEDLRGIIESTSEASSNWASTPGFKRGLILMKAGELMESEREAFSELMTIEEGKPLKDSRLEVIRSYNTLKFYGSVAMKHGGKTIPSANDNTMILTSKEPLGSVALISPWNFPLSIPVWKMAPALAAGNSVILKPASNTPLIAAMLVDVLYRAGLPENVVSMAVGSGRSIGNQLVSDHRLSAVSFTGSVPVGKGIYKTVGERNNMMRVQLELGGKNAMYVDEDADIQSAVSNAVAGAYGLTGQSCTATSRLLVHRRIFPEFRRKLLLSIGNWKAGDGFAPDSDMGPVVDDEQLKTDLSYVETGINEGANLVHGETDFSGNGLFLKPVLFENVTRDMKIFREEIFGPVLGMTVVDSLDEAIELTNSVEYGHTAGIMTSSLKNAMVFTKKVDAGVIKVNKPTVGLELQAPFGAFKHSGANTWKEMGEEAMDFYTKEKTTYLGW